VSVESATSEVWKATYLDGRTPVRRPATVRLFPTGLEIALDPEATLWWAREQVRQTQGYYTGEQVRLERTGTSAEAVVVTDVSFVTALGQVWRRPGARLHDPSRRGRRLQLTILAALGALVVGAVLYVWGIPSLADMTAARVPVTWEARLGEMVVAQLAPAGRRCGDPERRRLLDGVLTEVTRALPPSGYRLRLVVVDDDAVNAFATPGGQIVLLRGLLEFTTTADELAGVLAHEIQHVTHRHTTQAVLRHASVGVLLAAAVGDVSGLVAFSVESARTLATLRYSRRSEEQADRDGTQLLIDAGLDPGGLLAFLEALERRDPGTSRTDLGRYLSSHPATGKRIAALRAQVGMAPWPGRKLLPNYDWRDIGRVCG
jgi:predicted Zn-dependent protease